MPVHRPWSSMNQGHGRTYSRRSHSSRAVRPAGDAGSSPAGLAGADQGPWTTRCRPGRPAAGQVCGRCGVTPARLLVVARRRPGRGCKPCATDPAAGIARRSGGWPSRRSGRNDRQGVSGDRADGDVSARPGCPGEDDQLAAPDDRQVGVSPAPDSGRWCRRVRYGPPMAAVTASPTDHGPTAD
jgi:hypothetical protein